jgi:hypothetical protein
MNQTIVDPDFDDVLAELKNEIFATLNCIQIGKIESFDKTKQTARIQIQVRRRIPNGTTSAYPLLVDCPVVFVQGGGAYLDTPVSSGDYCLILFNDRNMDTWWNSANVAEPPTLRKHSLSDGFALVGINPRTSILDIDGNVLGLRGGTKKVRVDNSVETLKTLVDDLIDTVSNLVTVGTAATQTLDPATKAALTVVKTRFGTLLEA